MGFLDPANRSPTAQKGPADGGSTDASGDADWLKRAQDAYRDSTSYVDNNFRKAWDDSIRAFNNQHSSDSKYNHPSYDKRSKLFRPKIRSIIRKNEAAGAAAFFSNSELVSVNPEDPNNKMEAASASVMKALVQYRLTKSIPWYQVLLGGLQDAQAVGVACAHIYWEFQTGAPDPQGQASKPRVDRPVIDLFPVENLRIDPGANWMDPINSSPYVIHLMPMYVMDVREKMSSGAWRLLTDAVIQAAASTVPDSTRSARGKDRQDAYASDGKSLPDYEVVWVQRHIHRKNGEEIEFYTLSDQALLTSPRPLKDSVFHGKRPYVMGTCILETHKIMPSSIGTLGKSLQEEANEVANQRIDNVKFVLNKKWFVKRGRDVDLTGLMRNVPGGAVMMDDPDHDVREISWPDVTGSAFEEQGRIDNDMNDLLGNFSAGQVMADKGIQGPARNMAILQQSTGTLVEYLLRTFVETFVQPVLRQLMLLEQKYETDAALLALAGKKAEIFTKFGMDQVTDELLEKELTLTVNVGMGATDPQMKLQKFVAAVNTYIDMMNKPAPGLNLQEVGKEIFGSLGYSDGTRFFTNDDPNVSKMQAELQKQAKVIQDLNAKLQEKLTIHQTKIEAAKIVSETKLKDTGIKEENANLRNHVTHLKAIREADQGRQHKIVEQNITEDNKNLRDSVKNQLAVRQADKQHENDLIKLGIGQRTMGQGLKTPEPA